MKFHDTQAPPKVPPPNTITLGVLGFNLGILGEHIQSIEGFILPHTLKREHLLPLSSLRSFFPGKNSENLERIVETHWTTG